MDALGTARSSLMATLGSALQLAEQSNHNAISGQDDMFGLDDVIHNSHKDNQRSEYIHVADWSDEERLGGEKETLGIYLTGHPIIRYEKELDKFISTRLKDLRPGNVLVAGYIHRIRSRSGNKGRMAEVILEDRTARAHVTVYSDKFEQYRNYLIKDQLIIIRGDVVKDDFIESGYSITARDIFEIEQIRDKYARIRIKLSAAHSIKNMTESIQKILSSNRSGNCKVSIQYQNANAICNLDMGDKWRVNASDNLLESLKKLLGNDNVSLEYIM
jgi:DNA polymerase-3 subunit alpha